MKRIIILCFALVAASCCFAQQGEVAGLSRSLEESRAKADIVLSGFGTIPGRKMVYSLKNEHYYIVIHSDSACNEYVVSIDSACHVVGMKKIDHDSIIDQLKRKRHISRKQRKELKRAETDRQMLKEAFDLTRYAAEPITDLPDATCMAGVPSYFVIKDEYDNRYGEYCLPSITAPCPINPDLWVYLIRELMENIK